MEFDQPICEDSVVVGGTSLHKQNGGEKTMMCYSEAFAHIKSSVVPRNVESTEKKLSWLRSQIIGGGDTEFQSPFGTRRITYADHTATGRSLHYIEDYIINNVLPFYGNTHTSDSYMGQVTTKTTQEASKYIKTRLGGSKEDALIFCGSGTTAAIKRLQEVMGIAVPSILKEKILKIIEQEERWVVFVGPYEHHSNLLSWRQTLAEVIEIGLDQNGLIDMQELNAKLEIYRHANRPMLGSFSACSNVTGICSDTRALARLLHQYGVFACFDFAASGAYVDIDMRSGEIDGYDAIFLSPHKFIGGPGSPGILLMNKALYQLGSSAPSTCGGGTVDFVNSYDEKDTLYMEDIEERENAGTPAIIQKTRAALAFWVKDYIGYQEIERKEHEYKERAFKRLLPNRNIRILGNTSVARQAILSFVIYSTTNSSPTPKEELNLWKETGNSMDKPLHGSFVAKLLNDLFGIQARGGCACAGPYGHSLLNVDHNLSLAYRSAIKMGYSGVKPGWTRVSFPYYMSNEEFEFILTCLEFIAEYGQRFLHLYNFDWKTGNWTVNSNSFRPSFQELNRDINKQKNGKVKPEEGKMKMYASYLKTAKHFANLLPKFPPQRRIPADLDLSILHFRV